MEMYGVSRTVMREALRTLTSKGLVESRPKIGTRAGRAAYGTCSTPTCSTGMRASRRRSHLR